MSEIASLIKAVIDHISIRKMMYIFILTILLYFVMPDYIQAPLDSIHLPFLPSGSCKFIAFLASSYITIDIVVILYRKIFRFFSKKKAEKKWSNFFLNLNDEELEMIMKFIQYDESYLYFIPSETTLHLTVKGALTKVGHRPLSDECRYKLSSSLKEYCIKRYNNELES